MAQKTTLTKEQLAIYFNWSANALIGADPISTDNYLIENLPTIKRVARVLLADYTPVTLYRGVLLDEEVTELKPHKNFTFLSFSDSKDVATHFGNNVVGDGFPCMMKNFSYGYVATYTPCIDEIIFHWNFFNKLPYLKIIKEAGINPENMPLQREVTILQPATPLPVKKWNEFFPDYNRLCLGNKTSSIADLLF